MLKLTLKRAEGPTDQVGNLSIIKTFAQADAVLKGWSDSAPKRGGYDKCDFTLQLAGDCVEYAGRYDLEHWSVGIPDLKPHVLRRLANMGGADAGRLAALIELQE
jgi:hypothetical protein